MSFLKPLGSRVRVYLAGDQVGAVRERGLLRARVECEAARVQADDAGPHPWAAAVRALGELISGRKWRGLPVDVALSSEFVRFALVPGIRRQLSSQEAQALAHSVFSRVLDDAAWSVRYCAADRETIIAAAVEKSLLDSLEDTVNSRACTLRSVSPLWSCAVNRARRRLARRSAWMVLAESRAAAFGLLDRGKWRAVRAKALDAERGLGVARLIERESRYLGTDTRDVVVLGDEPLDEGFGSQWRVERVPLVSARLGALPVGCRPAALAGI